MPDIIWQERIIMMQGLYTSATGMQSHSVGLNVVSQNIANVNTVAFKQQLYLISDLGSKDLPAGAAYELEMKQVGMGSQIGEVRSNFNIGSYEIGTAETDLALSGKGYFQVMSPDNEIYYTRAGNFRFNVNGVLTNPSGHQLMGIPIDMNGNEAGVMEPISIDTNDELISSDPPKATTQINASVNLYNNQNVYNDAENPYFSMIQNWNGQNEPPLSSQTRSISLQFYDANGVKQSLQLYLDPAETTNGEQVYEYIIAMDPELDARPEYEGTKSAGLLMAGTMTFSSAGELKNMNAFSPQGGDLTDLANWSLAELNNGQPSVTLQMKDLGPQTISLNLGMKGNGWTNGRNEAVGGMTADQVGTEFFNIPAMTEPSYNSNATTALKTSPSLKNLQQDGYAKGELNNMFINEDGVVQLSYTNGQTHDIYRIPIARFTSEDGLYRAGNNLYMHTDEAGNMEFGRAGTENYGKVLANTLETSNVDMAREMVNMIVLQRGFQSNSKSLQTVDAMLQKAMELKRN